MRRQSTLYLLALGCLLGVTSNLVADGGAFTAIDFPGAASTIAWAINNRGDIVGIYTLADKSTHGFGLSGGQFRKIDFPAAGTTSLSGINPQGDVTGTYQSADKVVHGFLLSDGEVTSIDAPGAVTYTNTTGI